MEENTWKDEQGERFEATTLINFNGKEEEKHFRPRNLNVSFYMRNFFFTCWRKLQNKFVTREDFER